MNKQNWPATTSNSTLVSLLNVRVPAESAGQPGWTADPRPSAHPVISVLAAATWEDLKRFAEVVLGPSSFNLGVCYGMTENLAGGVASLLTLLKTFVLEGLYEQVHHPPPLWAAPLWPQYATARVWEIVIGDPTLQKAHNQCVELLDEVKKIIDDPKKFLTAMGKHYEQEYASKWARLKDQLAQRSLIGDFQAGRITGQVLLDVIMILLTVYGAAELAAKVAAEIPELVDLVRGLTGAKEALQVENASAVAASAVEAEDVSMASRAAKPPSIVERDAAFAKSNFTDLKVANGDVILKADRIRAGSTDPIAVIGRNMDDVRPYAEALRKQGYNVEIFDGPAISPEAQAEWTQLTAGGRRISPEDLTETKMFQENQAWANKLQGGGSTVIDIDNPRNSDPSPFYDMEGNTIAWDKPQ